MIKKLKTIEQIKSENKKIIEETNDSIFFFSKRGFADGSISNTMFHLFDKEIDVEPAETYKNYYQWQFENHYNKWYFKDEWFVDCFVVDLLDDSLFEL